MQDKLLAEFPDVTYESWREQVEKDLKGADFDKRLVTRTLEGLVVQPLYTARDVVPAPDRDPGGFAGLPPYQRGASAVGNHAARWDIRAEQQAPELARAKTDIAEDLAGGARSLWLRFDARARLSDSAEAAAAGGLTCRSRADLAALLADVDLARVSVTLDAGGNAALAALFFSLADARGVARSSLRGSLGCDPLGALARDGALPHGLPAARSLFGELASYSHRQDAPQLRAAEVSTLAYHDAGASGTQELAYALATGLEYLRWAMDAGLSINAGSAQLGFSIGVAGDLFLEIAKLRALRLCWAKLVAACGGDAGAQNMQLHAVTSRRTKTQRDPWVNILRTTSETFAAMVGGADALTTRGFDELLGVSDGFARRIARNVQTILNEEAHVTHVADAGGGSYYIDALTDQLARGAWQLFQGIEQRGGMASALSSGSVAKEIAELAAKRAAGLAKRSSAIIGVSEFANLSEEPVLRPQPNALAPQRAPEGPQPTAALAKLKAAGPGERIAAAIEAGAQGASLDQLTRALSGTGAAVRCEALPVRRHAEPFEALRARSEQKAKAGQPPTAFLCNLGAIPQHKARASFATGFLNAGGIAVLDNEGFGTPELAAAAFAASGCKLCVICGSDAQYPEWVPKLLPLLRERGATQIVLAGRPGEHEAAFTAQGVTHFIYMGLDVVATLGQLLDRLGVTP
jgi:methylmalonyl-CoA mutase